MASITLSDEYFNSSICTKYLEINEKILQFSKDFKEKHPIINQNEKTYYNNKIKKQMIMYEDLEKGVTSKVSYNLEEFEKKDLFKAIYYLTREIKEQSN